MIKTIDQLCDKMLQECLIHPYVDANLLQEVARRLRIEHDSASRYHSMVQQAGHAVGLLAGDDLTVKLMPALRQLAEDQPKQAILPRGVLPRRVMLQGAGPEGAVLLYTVDVLDARNNDDAVLAAIADYEINGGQKEQVRAVGVETVYVVSWPRASPLQTFTPTGKAN